MLGVFAMPKIEKGRISGLWGMETYTAAELLTWAEKLEAQIDNPLNEDDPKYLRRWAGKMRRLAAQKEKALSHKKRQGTKHT